MGRKGKKKGGGKRDSAGCPWACPICGKQCKDGDACGDPDSSADECETCDCGQKCRPWACPRCFTPCADPRKCKPGGPGCDACTCTGILCMPWICPSCRRQCLDPSKCGKAKTREEGCGCCDCRFFPCAPSRVPMDFGDVPVGGYHMGDTVAMRKSVDGSIPTDRVTFIGDSDIEFWEEYGNFTKHFPDAVNIGIGGGTMMDLAQHVEGAMVAVTPKDFVVACSGENDFFDDTRSAKSVFKNFQKAADVILRSKNKPRLIWLSTKPEPASKSFYKKYTIYDDLVKEMAEGLAKQKEPPPIVVMDMWALLKSNGNKRSNYNADDGLHMTTQGYDFVTPLVQAVIAGKIGKSRSEWCLSTPVASKDGAGYAPEPAPAAPIG